MLKKDLLLFLNGMKKLISMLLDLKVILIIKIIILKLTKIIKQFVRK